MEEKQNKDRYRIIKYMIKGMNKYKSISSFISHNESKKIYIENLKGN